MVSRKRPRSTETARPLLYYDEIRQAIVQSQNASNRAIPPGVTYQSSSSILYINPQQLLGTSEGDSFRLMHLPTLFGFSRHNGDGDRSVLSSVFITAKAALLAVEHFNNRDESIVTNLRELLTDSEGKECDLRMTLDFYDTERNALVASKRLAQDIFSREFPFEATAIVGAVRSAVSIPMAILNTVRNLPQISHSSTSSTLDERDTYRFFGRVIPSSNGDARALMQYYAELGVTHVGILYVQDDYGSAYRLSLGKAAAEREIQVGSAYINVNQEDRHGPGGIVDAIDKLRSLGYRYFVGVIFSQHVRIVIEVASQVGIMGPGYVWMIGDGVSRSTVTDLRLPRDSTEAQAVHGIGFISTGSATKSGHFDRFLESLLESDKTQDFRHLYAAKSPLLQDLVQFDLNQTVTTSGSSPPLAFDAVMALGIAGCKAPANFFTGKQLFDQFLNVCFGGASGPVSIDGSTGGRSYSTMAYKIVNVVATNVESDGMLGFEAKVAAEYYTPEGSDSASWTQTEGVQYNYSGMTLDPPPPLPPVEASRDSVETSALAMISAAACLVMLSAVVFGAWTWHYRSSHVVRASQPEFLVVICGGVFLMAASALTLGFEHPPFSFWLADASCMMNVWFFCTGFGIAFSALSAKTWRINKILSRKNQFRRMAIGPKDVLLPGTCIFLGNVAVLLGWQLHAPLHYLIVEEDSFDEYGRSNKISFTCQSSGNSDGYYYLALLVINGFAIIAANVQAFRARGITTEFSESKYIGLAMGVILQAIIIIAPVIFQRPGVTVNYLIRGIIILVTCSSILYLIFIPKIIYWRTWKPQKYRSSELFIARSSARKRLSFYTKRDGLVIPADSANKPGDSESEDVAVESPGNINQYSSLELASSDMSSSQPFGSGLHRPFRLSSLDSHSASLELSAAASGGGEIGCRQRVQSSTRQSHTDSPEKANREEGDDDSRRVGIQVIAFRKSPDTNELGRDSTSGLRVLSTDSQHSIDFAESSEAFDLEGNSFAEDDSSALAFQSLPRGKSVWSHASVSLGRPASQKSGRLELANSSCDSLLSGPKKRTSLNEENSQVGKEHEDEIDKM